MTLTRARTFFSPKATAIVVVSRQRSAQESHHARILPARSACVVRTALDGVRAAAASSQSPPSPPDGCRPDAPRLRKHARMAASCIGGQLGGLRDAGPSQFHVLLRGRPLPRRRHVSIQAVDSLPPCRRRAARPPGPLHRLHLHRRPERPPDPDDHRRVIRFEFLSRRPLRARLCADSFRRPARARDAVAAGGRGPHYGGIQCSNPERDRSAAIPVPWPARRQRAPLAPAEPAADNHGRARRQQDERAESRLRHRLELDRRVAGVPQPHDRHVVRAGGHAHVRPRHDRVAGGGGKLPRHPRRPLLRGGRPQRAGRGAQGDILVQRQARRWIATPPA